MSGRPKNSVMVPFEASLFPSFGALPTELRLKIWHFAAVFHPPRVIELVLPSFSPISQSTSYRTQVLGNGRPTNMSRTAVPATALVNSEARRVTLKLYQPIKMTRMEVRSDDPFQAFRPSVDIIFVAESAPLRWRRMRPSTAALFPLLCIAENPSDVAELQYVAMKVPLSDLVFIDMDKFVEVLRKFSKLKELFLIDQSLPESWTFDELLGRGLDLPGHGRVLVNTSGGGLAPRTDTQPIEALNALLTAYHTTDWTPAVSYRYCVKVG